MLTLAVLLIAGQALAAGPPPPGDLPPDQRAAALAASSFAFTCIARLSSTKSRAEFASGSDALGTRLARDFPTASASARLDGDGGRGCRVAYAGPLADGVWKAFSAVVGTSTPTADGGGCVAAQTTATLVRARCVDTGPGGPFVSELTIERTNPNSVVARVSDARP